MKAVQSNNTDKKQAMKANAGKTLKELINDALAENL